MARPVTMPIAKDKRRRPERTETIRILKPAISNIPKRVSATVAAHANGTVNELGKRDITAPVYSTKRAKLPQDTFFAPYGPHQPKRSPTADRKEAPSANRANRRTISVPFALSCTVFEFIPSSCSFNKQLPVARISAPNRLRRTVQFDRQIQDLALPPTFAWLVHREDPDVKLLFVKEMLQQSSPVVCDSPSPGTSWRNRENPATLRAHVLATMGAEIVAPPRPFIASSIVRTKFKRDLSPKRFQFSSLVYCPVEKLTHQRPNPIHFFFQRKMARVEKMKLCAGNIFIKEFSTLHGKDSIVFAPSNQHGGLLLREIFRH